MRNVSFRGISAAIPMILRTKVSDITTCEHVYQRDSHFVQVLSHRQHSNLPVTRSMILLRVSPTPVEKFTV